MITPTFAIIGHVNEGKSSVVATLVEDDAVAIADTPHTTKECRAFPLVIDERLLLTIVDTPGFENARRMLQWLRDYEQQHHLAPQQRPDALRHFYAQFSHSPDRQFDQECNLLAPILEGAGILYVVDGSHGPSGALQAELEILQWTGQPRIALINDKHHNPQAPTIQEWQRIFNQYFSLVRYFNAQRSRFADRLHLLNLLKTLNESWSTALDAASTALVQDQERRLTEAAALMATYLITSLTLTRVHTLPEGDDPTQHAKSIEEAYHNALRQQEAQCQTALARLFKHERLQVLAFQDYATPALGADLFAEATWQLLGLRPGALLAMGAGTGAAIGGTIDAFVGGASFLMGTLLGAAAGSASAYVWSRTRYMRATVHDVQALLTGAVRRQQQSKQLRVGPHRNPNFPWVLLDRALLFYLHVSQRAHSQRDVLDLAATARAGLVDSLPQPWKQAMSKIFHGAAKAPQKATEELSTVLGEVLRQYS